MMDPISNTTFASVNEPSEPRIGTPDFDAPWTRRFANQRRREIDICLSAHIKKIFLLERSATVGTSRAEFGVLVGFAPTRLLWRGGRFQSRVVRNGQMGS
jgi:hypothetical protein